jgi:signal transduction histidine kinase/DNA-binding NarL/FixJ family response regulator
MQHTRKLLTFPTMGVALLASFGIGLATIIVITVAFQRATDQLESRLSNERGRLVISEQLVNGILNMELLFSQIRLADSEPGYVRHMGQIEQVALSIDQQLHLLEHGGTMRHALGLNIYGIDEMVRTVSYSPGQRKAETPPLEVIEIAPLVQSSRVKALQLVALLRQRDACPADGAACRRLATEQISLMGKELPSFFYRMGENANRNFYEGLQTLDSLEVELQSQVSRLRLIQGLLIGLVGLSALGMAAFFVKRMGLTQNKLREAITKTEEASQAKTRFLATMSHEIRTPMNGILGMAQVLQTPGLDDKQRLAYVNMLTQSGQTLLRLLNDILDLSRVEAGKLELHPEPTAPNALCAEVVGLFSMQAESKGLTLSLSSSVGDDELVLIDPIRTRQMLSNLLSNAIKFTVQGSVTVELMFGPTGPSTDVLECRVTDTGIGVPADKLDQLFEAFSQVDDSTTRKYTGSGLGLSIVRRLAEQMGGNVTVSSSLGRGSQFSFSIQAPRVSNTLHTAAAAPSVWTITKPEEKKTDIPAFNAHVLIAEDNIINQAVLKHMLQAMGVSWVLAQNGQEALDICVHATNIDLVLMDMQMPVMGGVDAVKNIRQWERDHGRPRWPVVACTANAFDDDRKACFEAGMDDVLVKPVERLQLINMLKKWLPQKCQVSQHGDLQPKPSATADMTAVRFALDRLMPLLADQMFDAVSAFDPLQQACAGTTLEPGLQSVAQHMSALNLAAADLALRNWCEANGLQVTPGKTDHTVEGAHGPQTREPAENTGH